MDRGNGSKEENFESLLRGVLSQAYKHARYLTGDETEAQDLLQEAALQALKGFATFQPGTSFRAWFLRVLVNAFYMSCRRERRRAGDISLQAPSLYLYSKLAALNGAGSDPAKAYLNALTAEQIAEAIRALPPRYRAAATLYFLEDLPYQEIASILECSMGTVRSRLHRSRKLLQVALWRVAEEHGIVKRNRILASRAGHRGGVRPRSAEGPLAG